MKSFIFYLFLITLILTDCPNFNYLNTTSSACLPCSIKCKTCTSNLNCINCADGYYLNNSICSSCIDNCKQCTNITICIICQQPYILNNNSTSCVICSVPNAATCSTLVNVTTCIDSYYSQTTYCSSCVLNCKICSNSTNCVTCKDGYLLQYQNSVCSLCSGCKSCVSTLTNCSSCWNNYYIIANTTSGQNNCAVTICNIQNCLYCSSNNICTNCNQYYYLSNNNCIFGSSITCDSGSLGIFPNQCTINCSSNFYKSQSSTQFSCIPNRQISSNSIFQIYYYMLNDYKILYPNSYLQNKCGQFYVTSPADIALSIPNYYKVVIKIKGYSLLAGTLSINVQANNISQVTNITMKSECSIILSTITTVQLHYNTINISFLNNSNFGLIETFLLVYKCSSDCISCLNANLCLICISTLYQFQYKCISNCLNLYRLNQTNKLSCVQTCPSGYFNSLDANLSNYCQSCTLPCLTCTSATICFSCANYTNLQYYYLSFNNTCASSCPNGQYPKINICYNCISPCLTCTNQTNCLSCMEGFWNGTGCYPTCPDGYFGNLQNNNCDKCDPTCLTCLYSSTDCTSCTGTLILYQRQCLTNCLSGYYLSNGACVRCIAPCKQCSSTKNCTSCSIGYFYNNTCITTCPTSYFIDYSNQLCSACSATCIICTSLMYCSQCVVTYCLQSGICQNNTLNCTLSYYKQTTNNNCICTICSYPCNTCSSQTLCTSCLVNYLYNNTCILDCPTGYYGNDVNQSCALCNNLFLNCLYCTANACTTCTNGYLINFFATSNQKICIISCPQGLYNNSGACNYCVSPCSTCSSQSMCLSCIANYLLSSNQCVNQCPSGQYSFNSICNTCISPCLTCVSSTNCSSCSRSIFLNTQTYFYNFTCINKCPNGYYSESITLQCQQCILPCLTCSTSSLCLTCSVGFLINNKCSACLIGTYPDNITSTCINCKTNCLQCLNSTYCSYCTNKTYLYNNDCLTYDQCTKVIGYYPQNTTNNCLKCVSPCKICNSSTYCTQCLSGYLLFNSTCIIICPSGTFSLDNSCSSCQNFCLTCTQTSTTCLSCIDNYIYYQNQYTCLLICPTQTYKSGLYCLSCVYPCLQCTTQTSCTSCQNGVLYNTTCYSSCPSGYFTNLLICITCNNNCAQCSETASNCTQCANGLFLYKNQCLNSCPNLYFPDTEVNLCFSCISPCQYCLDAVTCTKCNSSYIYYKDQNSCVTSCPNSYFNTSNINNTINDSPFICQNCMKICLTCINSYSCVLCQSGYIYMNTCVSQCPSKMYPKSGVCLNCTLPCSQCSSATICKSCPVNQGYLLIGNSECILTKTCPSLYYLIPNSSNCTLNCPNGLYQQTQNSICSISCQDNYFKGNDYICYQSCPSNYYGNKSYYCNKCDKQCPNLLNFIIDSEIIEDSLYIYIQFTLFPIYQKSLKQSDIKITPNINFKIISVNNKKIQIQIFPDKSFQQTTINIRFLNSFYLFSSELPLQKPSINYILQGYNLYPQQRNLQIFGRILGVLIILTYLYNGYFGLDFGQLIFFYNLINIHYPLCLRSFFQGFKITHLFFKTISMDGAKIGKFKTSVNNMSLIQNTLNIMIILSIYFSILGIIMLINFISKHLHNNKVQDINGGQSNNNNNNLSDSTVQFNSRLYNLQIYFKQHVFLRLIYFLYSYLTLFTFSQIYNINNNTDLINPISRYLSILTFLIVTAIPILLYYFYKDKPIILILLLLRKYIICLCIVVAIKYPLYIIGFICVSTLCTIILMIAFRPIQFKIQLISYLIGQIIQFIVSIMIVQIAFLGEGYYTQVKISVSYAIIVFCSLGIVIYMSINILMVVIEILKRVKGIDYIQIWSKKEGEQDSNKEQSQNDMMSDVKLKKEDMKQKLKDIQRVDDNDTSKKNVQQSDKQNSNGFKVYQQQQNSISQQNDFHPPEVLIKVINKFEDFDKIDNNN